MYAGKPSEIFPRVFSIGRGKRAARKTGRAQPFEFVSPLHQKRHALRSKGIKTMEELNVKDLPLVELDVPNGVDAETHVAQFLGTQPAAHEDMPADADVDATVFIKLK